MLRTHSLLILCLISLVTSFTKTFEFSDSHSKNEKANAVYHQKDNDNIHTMYFNGALKQRHKRNVQKYIHRVQFKIDSTVYYLELVWRKRSAFSFESPVWIVEYFSDNNASYVYKAIDQKYIIFNGIFFEDRKTMTTLLQYYDKYQRKMLYNGIFGTGSDTHVIRSIPEYLAPFLEKRDNTANKKVSTPDNDAYKSNNSVSILYIKILPVIDYQLFTLLGGQIKETLKYVATFWNAVDLQFSKFDGYKIEISITGLVIATDERAFSFIDESRDINNSSKIIAYRLLEEARIFFYEHFFNDTGFTNYDAIFVMTALNTQPTAGMSYIGRICNRLYSTAFIQDDGNFLGLHSANHELGHLLNFFHDGSGEAKTCDSHLKNGESTVMASTVSNIRPVEWSQCSKNSLKEFMRTRAAKCLLESYRIK